jgi:hypothetical protein
MTQGSSGALTRQFRNAILRSLVALDAPIHLEHARIFTFVVIIFYHSGNFNLYKVEVYFEQEESSIARK